MKKLIFYFNNFFGSSYFWTSISDLMDQKMARAKKLLKSKINFFMAVNQAKQFLKSIHTGVVIL